MEWNANGDRTPASPLFPFGYGLSFTTFSLRNASIAPGDRPTARATVLSASVEQRATLGMLPPPAITSLTITATASNTGSVAGAVVVFVSYTKKPYGVVRWARMMCGFTKVFLKAGESREVSVEIKVSDLARWDTRERSTDLHGRAVTGAFVVDGGEYAFFVSAGCMESAT